MSEAPVWNPHGVGGIDAVCFSAPISSGTANVAEYVLLTGAPWFDFSGGALADGIFTCPTAGVLDISAYLKLSIISADGDASGSLLLAVYKNGEAVLDLDKVILSGGTRALYLGKGGLLPVNAGDLISLTLVAADELTLDEDPAITFGRFDAHYISTAAPEMSEGTPAHEPPPGEDDGGDGPGTEDP